MLFPFADCFHFTVNALLQPRAKRVGLKAVVGWYLYFSSLEFESPLRLSLQWRHFRAKGFEYHFFSKNLFPHLGQLLIHALKPQMPVMANHNIATVMAALSESVITPAIIGAKGYENNNIHPYIRHRRIWESFNSIDSVAIIRSSVQPTMN